MNDKANAATPHAATPSEPRTELRDGVPSVVAETVQDYFKRVYPEYYVQIITNMNAEHGPAMTANVLSDKANGFVLHGAFICCLRLKA